MRGFIGALAFALFAFCIAGQAGPDTTVRRKHLPKRIITIAYLLDGNGFSKEEAFEVEEWLGLVQQEAQDKLKEEFHVEITFVITGINITDSDLTEKIIDWSSGGLIRATTFLDYVKQYYKTRKNPDIICVITKYEMCDEDGVGYLAYFIHKTLCKAMVPMLLTYNQTKATDAGEHLYKLVEMSADTDKVKPWNEYYHTTSNKGKWKKYFRKCKKNQETSKH
uniref:Putative secreted protein n=1 Tax=Ixodes ricinus TaxID=34613 RepID=V5H7H9_IXORI